VENENTPISRNTLIETSLRLLQNRQKFSSANTDTRFRLWQVCLALIHQFYLTSHEISVLDRGLEDQLITELMKSVENHEPFLQKSLMEVILTALEGRRKREAPIMSPKHQRTSSKDLTNPSATLSVNSDGDEKKLSKPQISLPAKLMDCILMGISSPSSWPVLESWTAFLGHCLELYGEGLFQVLLPLVSCFCNTLESLLAQVNTAYEDSQVQVTKVLDPTIIILLNGLEQCLATGHTVLTTTEPSTAPIKSPEPQQASFFGNMVSGVFATEANKPKTLTPNNRLTVLLCFKDAIRICYAIWSWGDTGKNITTLDGSALASFKWIALRLRNRTRRIFEHLFAVEALECLETLIEIWQKSIHENSGGSEAVLDLLSTLETARPKPTIPAIFNAIYSRTNPAALEPNRKSTLTSSISDVTLADFLVTYVRSLDDDAMDEIWNDCITFLKDVLANPMPHRQTLASLIEFTAILGEKVENTKFGEQRKMRRELGVSLYFQSRRFLIIIVIIGSIHPPSLRDIDNTTYGHGAGNPSSRKAI
jgi:hypothetical protein